MRTLLVAALVAAFVAVPVNATAIEASPSWETAPVESVSTSFGCIYVGQICVPTCFTVPVTGNRVCII